MESERCKMRYKYRKRRRKEEKQKAAGQQSYGEQNVTRKNKIRALIKGLFISVAQSRRVKNLFPELNSSLAPFHVKYQTFQYHSEEKHSCSPCIILYKHLTILFELCSSTHYTSFEEVDVGAMLHFDFAAIKYNTAAHYS